MVRSRGHPGVMDLLWISIPGGIKFMCHNYCWPSQSMPSHSMTHNTINIITVIYWLCNEHVANLLNGRNCTADFVHLSIRFNLVLKKYHAMQRIYSPSLRSSSPSNFKTVCLKWESMNSSCSYDFRWGVSPRGAGYLFGSDVVAQVFHPCILFRTDLILV